LNISGGGHVLANSIGHFYIGFADAGANSSGIVNVDGPGSQLIMQGSLRLGTALIGGTSSGELNITNGGYVASPGAELGRDVDMRGDVDVSGAGSQWIVSDTLFVGSIGKGTLNISGGGYVQCVSTEVAAGTGTTGVVTVAGSGTWNSTGNVSIGGVDSGA